MLQVLNIIKCCILSGSLHIVSPVKCSSMRRVIAALDLRWLGSVILQVLLPARKIVVSILAWAVTIYLIRFLLILRCRQCWKIALPLVSLCAQSPLGRRRRCVGYWVDPVKEPKILGFCQVGLHGILHNFKFPSLADRKGLPPDSFVNSPTITTDCKIPASPPLALANYFDALQTMSDVMLPDSVGERVGCPSPIGPPTLTPFADVSAFLQSAAPAVSIQGLQSVKC
ncbi:hypothetical protein NE237_002947 [Protea cynaroides]|uniref:Uncharacterized protein n=1 Tax=Protea cynaroides TaxID=273540 RepID=A0A9Q0KFX6_9MAGN|nr:hypothetical protein NE237_002947 [Protea cynaroides]